MEGDRQLRRESFGGERSDLVRGHDNYNTGPWSIWSVSCNVDYTVGKPLTTWADDDDHSYTWQEYWMEHNPTTMGRVAGMQCEWDFNMFPYLFGATGGWVESFGNQDGHEIRFELVDSAGAIVKNARITFETLNNSAGHDYWDEDAQEWVTGSHIATYNAKCKGSSQCAWEFDWDTPPKQPDGSPPGPVTSWSGFRLYWYPFVPGPFTPPKPPPVVGRFEQATPDVGLLFWPTVDWSWVRDTA